MVFIDTFVVMKEIGRNVDPVGARHTIIAVVAGDGGMLHHYVGSLMQEIELFVGECLQRRVSVEVVFQMLHICRYAEHRKHDGL